MQKKFNKTALIFLIGLMFEKHFSLHKSPVANNKWKRAIKKPPVKQHIMS